MEEFLVALIQFLIEVVGQSLISMPFDCLWRGRETRSDSIVWVAFAFLFVGAVVGWMSTGFFERSLIHIPALRILSLIVTPLLGGTIGFHAAKWRSRHRDPLVVPGHHFWYSLAFTLGLTAVRFAYVKH